MGVGGATCNGALPDNCCETCDSDDQSSFAQVNAHPLEGRDGLEIPSTGSMSSKIGLGRDDNGLPSPDSAAKNSSYYMQSNSQYPQHPQQTPYGGQGLHQVRNSGGQYSSQQNGTSPRHQQQQKPYSEEAMRQGAHGLHRIDTDRSDNSYQMAVTLPPSPEEVRKAELDMLHSQAAALQRVVRKPDKETKIVTHYEEELRKLMQKINDLEQKPIVNTPFSNVVEFAGGVSPRSSGGATPRQSGGATPRQSGGATPRSAGGTPRSAGGATYQSGGTTFQHAQTR